MQRLLDQFIPETYTLDLTISRADETISGVTIIKGLAKSPIVKLHAVNLQIDSVSVWSSNSKNSQTCAFHQDPETLTINLPEHFPLNQPLKLTIKHHSSINHNLQGCYLSTYEFAGQTKKLAATQFESHYAREVFPCVDEPAAKAQFNLILNIPDLAAQDVVLANTELKSRAGNRFEFATTPRMPTYLLAWVIGPLQSRTLKNANGIEISTFCALNHPLDSVDFANETAARALEYYDSKYSIPYPLAKLDQVALPDFEAGAMENWGLVIYRESCLLADSHATDDSRRSVAVTVTHELAHQWFGNLVTMYWWDDLWLNEAFATIMEYYATDALYPDYQIWQDFYTSDCVAALRRDYLPGVQAVQQPVHHPAEIATLFDAAIVYAKGARLVLMLMRLLGADNFYRGVHDYLQKFQYQNAVGDDLWQSLQPYADFNIKDFMHSWISRPGYPALSRSSAQNSQDNDPVFSLYHNKEKKSSLSANSTAQPVEKSVENSQNPHISSTSSSWHQTRFLIAGTAAPETWPLPEVFDDMSGHYLINLSDQDFSQKIANFASLSIEQKLRLLIDHLLLAKTPAVLSASLLDLLPKFSAETSSAVWDVLLTGINDLKLFCPEDSPAANLYKDFLAQTFLPLIHSLDLGHLPDQNSIRLRDALLALIYYIKDSDSLARLAELYSSDFTQIDPELLTAVLLAKLYLSESELFPELLSRYPETASPELRSSLLAALCSARDSDHISTLISLLSNPQIVRPQDHIFLFVYLLRNFRAKPRALDWLYSHWDYVVSLAGEKSVEDYVRYAASSLRTEDESAAFFAFFDHNPSPALSRALDIARVEIPARLELIKLDSPGVLTKLQTLVSK